MASNAHPKTLFHLVPANQVAQDSLFHPDNKRFVSSSREGPGLEVGYHVPSLPRGHVITRLGRDADLILRKSTPEHAMSAVHVAFEVNPTTHLVLLSVRSKRVSSVTLTILQDKDKGTKSDTNKELITGDCVIFYGQDYKIAIASYKFKLIWRTISKEDNVDSLKSLTVQDYEISLQLLQGVRSRDRPTETDTSEAQSWHITRFNTARGPLFRDIRHLRSLIGKGAYGRVYSAVDQTSGYKFAIKVVDLGHFNSLDIETARAFLHREIKVMERLKHVRTLQSLPIRTYC